MNETPRQPLIFDSEIPTAVSLKESFSSFYTTSVANVSYYLYQYWVDLTDPRVKHLPLLNGGPEFVLSVLAVYLSFVLVIGPRLMAKRKPFVLRWPIFIYNVLMVVFNALAFLVIIEVCQYGRRFLDFKFPDQNDRSTRTMQVINWGWYLWMCRFVDLFDTFFIVLRKKQQQISFLHLYHHTVVPLLAWMCFKVNPMLPVIQYFLLFNTLIHSIMYSYYALASFGPAMQKYLWWKRYLTQLQLLQFFACFCYGCVMTVKMTGYPSFFFWIGFWQNPIFFYMFYQFYRQSYQSKKAKIMQPKKYE